MKLLQKLTTGLLAMLLALPTVSLATELSFLNWSDYMDPEILDEFRQRTGITVKEIYFDSDSARDALLLETDGKGFDLAIVNGVSLRVLAKRGWLEPISEQDIPNLKHVDMRWRTAHEKARDYGVPYFWGTLGIAYRSDLVPVEITSWMDLFRPHQSLHGKISMISDPSDMIGVALKALGHSINSGDRQALKAAEALLQEQASNVKTYDYISLDEDSALVSGQVGISLMYSGDALMVQEHNEDITYVVPEEGGSLWVDYLCIMRESTNKQAAKRFIDFLNEPEIAARLAEYVYYASPNVEAEKLLPTEFTSDPVIYPPPEILAKSETYKPLKPRVAKRRTAIYSRIVH